MDEKKSILEHHGRKYTPVLVAIVGAFIGSSGTVAIYVNTPIGQKITRPDPFTGTQAAALIERMDRVESDVSAHRMRHPSDDMQYDRRIAVLETKFSIILQNQGRILDRLDNM
jgi:hypothetical protein